MRRILADPLADHGSDTLWVYNSLDCMALPEIWTSLAATMADLPYAQRAYSYVRGMCAVALAMQLRGIMVDEAERDRCIARLEASLARLRYILSRMSEAICGAPLNPRSKPQLKALFYDAMSLPAQYTGRGDERRVTVNREALEALRYNLYADAVITPLLLHNDLEKLLQFMRQRVDAEGRFHANFNPAGTDTGRWSSSKDAFGLGQNLQNVTEEARRCFIATPGLKLCQMDQAQAESRWVAWLSRDPGYIEAHASGDTHTYVSRLIFPHLPWTGELKQDKKIATDTKAYRHMTYRDLSKRIQHGTNYGGSARFLAQVCRIPAQDAITGQAAYFRAFPGIQQTFWGEVAKAVQTQGWIETPLGFRRQFFGRVWDTETLKSAYAHVPQSTVGMTNAIGIYRVWDQLRSAGVHVLVNGHDSILFEYPPEREAEIIPHAKRLMEVSVLFEGRLCTVPVDVAVGWNWGKVDPQHRYHADGNPRGLREWKEAA